MSEERSDAWQTQHVFETPMEIAWQFDYSVSQERLENLCRKAKETQWNVDEDVDWSPEIDPSRPLIDDRMSGILRLSIIQKLSQSQRDEFSAHFAARLLSQFPHGEQGALMTASVVTHALPNIDAKLYAAAEIPVWDDAGVLESIEDGATGDIVLPD